MGNLSLPVATDLSLNASRRPVTSQGQWWSKVLPASTLSSREATTPKGETATLARRTCRRAHSFGLCGLFDFSLGGKPMRKDAETEFLIERLGAEASSCTVPGAMQRTPGSPSWTADSRGPSIT